MTQVSSEESYDKAFRVAKFMMGSCLCRPRGNFNHSVAKSDRYFLNCLLGALYNPDRAWTREQWRKFIPVSPPLWEKILGHTVTITLQTQQIFNKRSGAIGMRDSHTKNRIGCFTKVRIMKPAWEGRMKNYCCLQNQGHLEICLSLPKLPKDQQR